VATGKELRKLNISGDNQSVQISPDGRFIAAKTSRGLWIWDATTGKEVHSTSKSIHLYEFSPDSRFLIASGESIAIILDVTTGKILQKLEGHTDFLRSNVFSPDSRFIATASIDGTARIWSAVTGRKLFKIESNTDDELDNNEDVDIGAIVNSCV
jgi:WD40 repeat protein